MARGKRIAKEQKEIWGNRMVGDEEESWRESGEGARLLYTGPEKPCKARELFPKWKAFNSYLLSNFHVSRLGYTQAGGGMGGSKSDPCPRGL